MCITHCLLIFYFAKYQDFRKMEDQYMVPLLTFHLDLPRINILPYLCYLFLLLCASPPKCVYTFSPNLRDILRSLCFISKYFSIQYKNKEFSKIATILLFLFSRNLTQICFLIYKYTVHIHIQIFPIVPIMSFIANAFNPCKTL